MYNDHAILRNRDLDDAHTQYLLIDGSRAMSGDIDMGGNDVINVGLVDGVDVSAHAARHIRGGADLIDADRLTVTYIPSNYTRDPSPPEAGNLTDLTAHLAGIDDQLVTVGTDDWQAVLTRGNASGPNDVIMSNGYHLRSGTAGGSDLGPVGNEFGTLRLVDDAIVGGDLTSTNADILTTVRVGNFTGSPAINLDKDDAGRVDIRFRNDTGVGGSWFSVVYNSSEDMIVNRLSNTGGFLDSVLAIRSAGNIDVDLAGHGVDFGGDVVVDGDVTIGTTTTGVNSLNLQASGSGRTDINFIDGVGIDGYIRYTHSARDLRISVEATESYIFEIDELRPVSGRTISLGGTTRWENLALNGYGLFGGALTSDASAAQNDIIVRPVGGGDVGMTLVASTIGTYAVSGNGNQVDGAHRYEVSSRNWIVRLDNSNLYRFTPTGLRPEVAGAVDVGLSGSPFGRVYLDDQINLSNSAGSVSYIINKNTAGTYAQTYQDGGLTRWNHVFSTGENLQWDRYDGGGLYIDTSVLFSNGGPVLLNNQLYVGSLSTSGYPTGTRIAVGDGSQAAEYISFDTTAAGVGGILIGDSVDNDEGRWLYNMAGRWDMWTSGTRHLEFFTNAVRPVTPGAMDIGGASNGFGTAYLTAALRFTGTTGIIGVDGITEWEITADAIQPAVNGGNSTGSPTKGLGSSYFANASTPSIPTSANAAVYSASTDSRLHAYYASGETHKLDQAPFLKSYTVFDGTPEMALNVQGSGFAGVSAISGTDQQRAEYNFVAPYDCRIIVHCWPTDAANDDFGTTVCRVYGDYDTGSGDIDSDAINWNAGSTGIRTYEFSTVFTGGEVYGITLQPGASDTSYVNVIIELAAA